MRQRERMPDLSPQLFRQLVALTPSHAQASYCVLVITGLRLGEYLALTKADLMPATHAIRIGEGEDGPDGKTSGAYRILPIDSRLWPWVERGIPAQLKQGWLRKHWYRACDALGVPRIHLHDLRRCTGQWLVDAGQNLVSVKATLGHATLAMTERYARRQLRATDARRMGDIFAATQLATQPPKSEASAEWAVQMEPIVWEELEEMARGGIEPPTRGFSVPNRPYTLDQHRPYRATMPGLRVVARCPLSPLFTPRSGTIRAHPIHASWRPADGSGPGWRCCVRRARFQPSRPHGPPAGSRSSP